MEPAVPVKRPRSASPASLATAASKKQVGVSFRDFDVHGKKSTASERGVTVTLQRNGVARPRSAPLSRPASGGMRRSSGQPLKAKQSLATMDIWNRHWYQQALDHNGHLSMMSRGKLAVAAAERGLEYEILGIETPDELPSLPDIVESLYQEFDMNTLLKQQVAEKQLFAEQVKKGKGSKPLQSPVPQVTLLYGSSVAFHSMDDWTKLVESPWRVHKHVDKRSDADISSIFAGLATPPNSPGLKSSNEEKTRVKWQSAAREEEVKAVKKKSALENLENLRKSAIDIGMNAKMKSVAGVAEAIMESESRLIPWDDAQMQKAFLGCADESSREVFLDDLPKVLDILGIRPNQSRVAETAKAQTKYGTVDYNEFKDFLRSYRRWEIQEMQRLWKESDLDGNGVVDLKELFDMLRKLGYPATWNTLLEIHLASGQDRDSNVTFDEFEKVLHHLRATSGIAGQELERLSSCFDRLTANLEVKELTSEDIWRILIYFSYPAEREEVRRLTLEVDENSNGILSFYEFLKLVRMYRDKEHESVARLVKDHGKSGEDSIALADLGRSLGDLGYHISHAALLENVEALGELEQEDCLSVQEMTMLLREHRRTEGFTKKGMNALMVAFQKGGGTDEYGHISVLGLGQTLRWLGFGMTLQERQKAVYEVDLDGNGTLEFNEFLKLMRRLHHQETSRRREVFQRWVPHDKDRLQIIRLGEVLKQVNGFIPEAHRLSKALAKLAAQCLEEPSSPRSSADDVRESLDIHEFDNLCEIYRRLEVTDARKHAGYTSREIEDLRKTFRSYDWDDSGSIERSELRNLLKEIFPEVTSSMERHHALEKMLQRIDTDGNGKLDFEEFLWLMREADDSRDAAEVAAEAALVPQIGLSIEEAEGFREIFLKYADPHGLVVLRDVFRLLEFVDFNSEQLDSIAKLVQKVGTPGAKGIRFPEFLRLLQLLSEDRSTGVQQASLRVAREERDRQQMNLRAARESMSHRRKSSAVSFQSSMRSAQSLPARDPNKRSSSKGIPTSSRSSIHNIGRFSSNRKSLYRTNSESAKPSKRKTMFAFRGSLSDASMPEIVSKSTAARHTIIGDELKGIKPVSGKGTCWHSCRINA